jgi:hypothetical protein
MVYEFEGLVGENQYDLRRKGSGKNLRRLELIKWPICKLDSSIHVNKY